MKIGFPISHLQPFDLPDDEQINILIDGQDTVHFRSRIALGFDQEAYVDPEVRTILSLLEDRGAQRLSDYILVIEQMENIDYMFFFTVHAKTGFISLEEDK